MFCTSIFGDFVLIWFGHCCQGRGKARQRLGRARQGKGTARARQGPDRIKGTARARQEQGRGKGKGKGKDKGKGHARQDRGKARYGRAGSMASP